ncbi:unnamed protein product [Urochloa humidicola]
MATRSLLTRTSTTVASALRRRTGPGLPPPAHQPLHAIPSEQNGIATRRFFSYDVESARDMLEIAKRQDTVMRTGIKWISRGVKVVEWACYFCVPTTIAAAVMVSRE